MEETRERDVVPDGAEGGGGEAVVTLNLQAVELMRQGLYEEAMSKLNQALSVLSSHLPSSSSSSSSEHSRSSRGGSPNSNNINHNEDESSSSAIYANVNVYVLPVYLGEATVDTVPLVGADGTFHFFNRGLLLLSVGTLSSSSSSAGLSASSWGDARTCAAVLCYNLAAVHHLLALAATALPQQQPGQLLRNTRELNYRKALSLYNMTEALIDKDGDSAHYSRAVDHLLIRLSLVNNKGHVHFCLNDVAEAESCVKTLLIFVLSTASRTENAGILGVCDVLPFIALNVLLHCTKRNTAPAA